MRVEIASRCNPSTCSSSVSAAENAAAHNTGTYGASKTPLIYAVLADQSGDRTDLGIAHAEELLAVAESEKRGALARPRRT